MSFITADIACAGLIHPGKIDDTGKMFMEGPVTETVFTVDFKNPVVKAPSNVESYAALGEEHIIGAVDEHGELAKIVEGLSVASDKGTLGTFEAGISWAGPVNMIDWVGKFTDGLTMFLETVLASCCTGLEYTMFSSKFSCFWGIQ